jgi:excisionase family DNA binding protein
MGIYNIHSGAERPQKRFTCTIEAAGEMLGIGRSLAYQAARRGEIPTIRLGRKLLVPLGRLEQMIGPIESDGPAGNPAEREDASGGSHEQAYT